MTMVAVEVLESSMVAPCEATPRHKLWLSDIDSLSVWSYTPTIYYFKQENYAGDNGDFFSPEVLKASLSKTLVLFYPLAGRLVTGEGGRREIDCSGEGALFVVARSESTLDELGEVVPCELTKRALIPAVDSGRLPCLLTMFQITFFKCGGVCLGVALHHSAADGASSIQFINTWGDIARGASADTVPRPFIDRTVLRDRAPKNTARHASTPVAPGPFVTAVLKLSKSQVDRLKSLSGERSQRVSTFKVVAAHVWRCACRARRLSGDVQTRMYSLMDFRRRVSPPLPEDYLGNALFLVSISAKVDELLSRPLRFGVERIDDTLAEVSFVTSPPPDDIGDGDGVCEKENDYVKSKWSIENNEIWVGSWMSMPVYELDFGYGKPTFMVKATMKSRGILYLMRDSAGGVSIVASFEPETMPSFKKLIYEGLDDSQEEFFPGTPVKSKLMIADHHPLKAIAAGAKEASIINI